MGPLSVCGPASSGVASGLVCCWGGGLGGWGVLSVGGRQREEEGAGEEEEFAGHVIESTGTVRHHVQLYSVVLDAGSEWMVRVALCVAAGTL